MAEIVRAVGTRDVAACFRWTADYVETGADLAQFVRDLAEHVRNMYVLTLAGADVALEVSDATRREQMCIRDSCTPACRRRPRPSWARRGTRT